MADGMGEPSGVDEAVIFRGIVRDQFSKTQRKLVTERRLVLHDDQVVWHDETGRSSAWGLRGQPVDGLPEVASINRISVPSIAAAESNVHIIFAGVGGEMLADVSRGPFRVRRYADLAYPMSALEPLRGYGIDVIEERIGTFTEFQERHPDGTTNPVALAARRLVFRLL